MLKNESSVYIINLWGLNISLIITMILFSMYYSKGFNNAITNILDNQIEVVIPVLIIGTLIISAEIVITGVQIFKISGDDSGGDYS